MSLSARTDRHTATVAGTRGRGRVAEVDCPWGNIAFHICHNMAYNSTTHHGSGVGIDIAGAAAGCRFMFIGNLPLACPGGIGILGISFNGNNHDGGNQGNPGGGATKAVPFPAAEARAALASGSSRRSGQPLEEGGRTLDSVRAALGVTFDARSSTFEDLVRAQLGLDENRGNTGGTVVDAIANSDNPAGLRGLVEIKQSDYLYPNKQIRLQLAKAHDLDLPYNLVVGPETDVSAPSTKPFAIPAVG